ncbi:CRISPR-associated endonuclease Cas1 [Hazenella sp. IB182353]|uniref:CRISPR-associated endonuclease Cas1 n=1 Tax=Polycladospora coralii TaxID=2771432 RepID=UPI001745C8B8|nr:CRISPR-associated endonuclease Cas1 [Polycladospora coralii]MBS7531172.1 CRISPR-associated endonuclease Cas1 [Polycladospora coralii]
MGTFYLTEPYCFIRKESERLKIYKDKKLLKEVRVNDFLRFYIHDSSTLTTDALMMLAEKGIDVVYFSHNQMVGRFIGKENKNVRLRIAQVESHLSEEKSLLIARNMILAKLKNTRTNLQRFSRRHDLDLQHSILALKHAMKSAMEADHLEQLRGIEGVAAKAYFSSFPSLILKKEFTFNYRSRRPAKDEVNALLNYGYALLRAEITSALQAAGLDPYIGFLHRERYGRESLSLDLMEEFRSIFVDNLIIKMINKGMIKSADIDHVQGEFRIRGSARKRFIELFDQKRKDEVTHELLQKKMSYREVFHRQAILLAKFIKSEMDDYYPFLIK